MDRYSTPYSDAKPTEFVFYVISRMINVQARQHSQNCFCLPSEKGYTLKRMYWVNLFASNRTKLALFACKLLLFRVHFITTRFNKLHYKNTPVFKYIENFTTKKLKVFRLALFASKLLLFRVPQHFITTRFNISHYKNTPVFKYIDNFTTKNWKFSDKNSDMLSYFCSKQGTR